MSQDYKDIALRASLGLYGEPYDADYFKSVSKITYHGYTDVERSGELLSSARVNDLEAELCYSVSGLTVLVVGCAFGHLVDELASRGATAKGMDISSYAVTNAQTLFPTRTFAVGDIRDMSGEAADTYDLVVLPRVLTCLVTTTGFLTAINEVKRVLKTGGDVYALVMDTTRVRLYDPVTGEYAYRTGYQSISDGNINTYAAAGFPGKVITLTRTGDRPIGCDRRLVVGWPKGYKDVSMKASLSGV